MLKPRRPSDGWLSVMDDFEDTVQRHLSRLYSAALFMCGGAESTAQDRVVEALGRSASEWLGPFQPDASTWLEERVVLRCLECEGRQPARARPIQSSLPRAVPLGLREMDRARLYAAAAALPPTARAAVWLVMFSRRPYAEVADVLDISRDALCQLLAHRDALIASLLRGGQDASDAVSRGT